RSDISENLQATLHAKHHSHPRPFLKSVQIVPPLHDCAGPMRERSWSILACFYRIAATPCPGPQPYTKNVRQDIQTNWHHARSLLHPRALTEGRLEEWASDSPFPALSRWLPYHHETRIWGRHQRGDDHFAMVGSLSTGSLKCPT